MRQEMTDPIRMALHDPAGAGLERSHEQLVPRPGWKAAWMAPAFPVRGNDDGLGVPRRFRENLRDG